MDCSPPGTPVPGILQARTLEQVATGVLGLYNFITGKTKGKPSKTVTVQREKIYCHQRALSCPFCVPCSNLYWMRWSWLLKFFWRACIWSPALDYESIVLFSIFLKAVTKTAQTPSCPLLSLVFKSIKCMTFTLISLNSVSYSFPH